MVTFDLNNPAGGSVTDGKRGNCIGPAVFLGKTRFAVLDRQTRQIVVKNMNNETTKRVPPPQATVDCLFDGGASGRVLLRSDDRAVLFEVQSRRVLGEIAAPKLKSVIWSPDGSKVALLCKYGVVLADRSLEQLCSVNDSVRIKSGAWDASPDGGTAGEVFVYTTLHHVKYVLVTGDTGTIRTLDSPIYAMRVVKDSLFCLDREARARAVSIDTSEARFKLALSTKRVSIICGCYIGVYLPIVLVHYTLLLFPLSNTMILSSIYLSIYLSIKSAVRTSNANGQTRTPLRPCHRSLPPIQRLPRSSPSLRT